MSAVSIEVSYSEARAHLAELLDKVSNDREVVRIRRQGTKPGAVLIDAEEYANLEETAHLLSSPANVRHLLEALGQSERGEGTRYASVEELWRDVEFAAAASEVEAPQVTLAPTRKRKPRTGRRKNAEHAPSAE
jgi:antitoxin YefM